jgi:ATP-dependent helicase HrpB
MAQVTGRIVMLEPRRLAARAAAAFMARGFGEPVGKTVGYRVRMDTKVSAETRCFTRRSRALRPVALLSMT